MATDESNYTVHCIKCSSTNDLRMIAHRIAGRMVGWVFVCTQCEASISGVELDINIFAQHGHEADVLRRAR